jgi:hypothetical protein
MEALPHVDPQLKEDHHTRKAAIDDTFLPPKTGEFTNPPAGNAMEMI